MKIATEGAPFGSVLFQIPKGLVIVSDDAGQFNISSIENLFTQKIAAPGANNVR